jgi:hypothetical protein
MSLGCEVLLTHRDAAEPGAQFMVRAGLLGQFRGVDDAAMGMETGVSDDSKGGQKGSEEGDSNGASEERLSCSPYILAGSNRSSGSFRIKGVSLDLARNPCTHPLIKQSHRTQSSSASLVTPSSRPTVVVNPVSIS